MSGRTKYLLFYPTPMGMGYSFISPPGEDGFKTASMSFIGINLTKLAGLFTEITRTDRGKLTTAKVEDITLFKANTLHYYIREGAIIPDVDRGEGNGKQRLFSLTNVIEVAILSQLKGLRMPRKAIARLFKRIRETGDRENLDPENILKG